MITAVLITRLWDHQPNTDRTLEEGLDRMEQNGHLHRDNTISRVWR